jgi:carbon monoxide dehydrogenase subunit G
MAITFQGEFHVAPNPDAAYDFLTDPNKFGPLLPDFEGMSVDDATHFTVKAKVGISHIRGTAEVKMHLAEAERPRRAAYVGRGSVAGGSVELKAGFDLEAVDGGTRVRWKGEATIFGRLTSIAGGLLEPLAKKNVQKLIDGLQRSLESEEA